MFNSLQQRATALDAFLTSRSQTLSALQIPGVALRFRLSAAHNRIAFLLEELKDFLWCLWRECQTGIARRLHHKPLRSNTLHAIFPGRCWLIDNLQVARQDGGARCAGCFDVP